jgi:hypothetical protein
MSDITWACEGDFDRDGSYETDLTSYVAAPGSGLSITRGMGRDGVYRISSVGIDLSNKDGTFTPTNTASSLYGLLEPRVPIRIKATHNSTTYVLWTGYIKSYKVAWAVGSVPICHLECDDIAAYLANYTPLYVTVTERTTSAALQAIATAMGLDSSHYALDTGQQTLPYHWVAGQNAMTAWMEAVRSEMGGGSFPNADGVLRFESRHARLGVSPHHTWGDGTVLYPNAIDHETSDDDLISSATVQAQILIDDEPDQTIFGFSRNADNEATSMSLAAGAIWDATEPYPMPVLSVTEPVSGTDYTAHAAADGSGTDMTSNLDVTIEHLGTHVSIRLENTHASDTLYVTKFELKGLAVGVAQDRPQFTTTKAIPNQVTDSGVTIFLPFADDSGTPPKAQDYSAQLAFAYRYPYPRITLHFDGAHSDPASDTTKKDSLLSIELGDRVKYDDTDLGASLIADGIASGMINDWFYIEAIRYQIPPNWGGRNFKCDVTLIPTYLYRNLDAIAYDFFSGDDASGDLGTSSSGDVWANDGNVDIAGNAARANSDTLQMPNLPLGANDQVIDFSLSEIGTGDEVGVVFRYVDANNQYRFYVDKGSNEAILEKNVATVVTEVSSPALTVGTAHEGRVIIQDTRIRCIVDRKVVIDTTDTALKTGTRVGLFLRNASGTTKVDDFVASGLNAPPTGTTAVTLPSLTAAATGAQA